MTTTFIRIGQHRLINQNHIIDAQFSPADPGGADDGEGGTFGPSPARLVLVTTALTTREYADNGNTDAAASESVNIIVRGEWAETAWAILQTADVTVDA